MNWRASAACIDKPVEWFFPPPATGSAKPDFEPALEVCRECPSLTPCRRWAEDAGDIVGGVALHGVVGGVAPKSKGKSNGRAPGVELVPCGTRAAYIRHLRHGETPCDECRAANHLRSAAIWRKRAAS